MVVRRLGWAAHVVWLGAVAGLLAYAEIRHSAAGVSLLIADAALGLGFAVTAVLLDHQEGQQANARLFGLLTVCWVSAQLAVHGVGWLTAPLIVLGGLTQVVAAAAVLRYPKRRLERVDAVFVRVVGAVLLVVQVALVVTGTSGMWAEVPAGLPWPTLVVAPGLNHALGTTRYAIWAVAGTTFLVLLVRRWRRASRLERRLLLPIVATAAIAGLLIAVRIVDDRLPAGLAHALELARAYAATLVSVGFVVSALQMRLVRGSVGDLAARLADPAHVGRVRDALRTTLGDPALEIWYCLPDQDVYADEDGVVVSSPETGDRMVVPVTATDGLPLAIIVADPDLARHRRFVDAVVAVSSLALENARLQASLQVQLAEVRRARGRLMSAGLRERRTLERDLHDGAQQRLLAIGLRLAAIQNATPDRAAVLAVQGVREELKEALEELRSLAHGLYPAVLSQAGLAAALETVAERLTIDVDTEVAPGRWPADVESAAYLIACEALTNAVKHADACRIRLRVAPDDGCLQVEVSDDGRGSLTLAAPDALARLRDRAEALGGSLTVTSVVGSGTTVVAMLPCT